MPYSLVASAVVYHICWQITNFILFFHRIVHIYTYLYFVCIDYYIQKWNQYCCISLNCVRQLLKEKWSLCRHSYSAYSQVFRWGQNSWGIQKTLCSHKSYALSNKIIMAHTHTTYFSLCVHEWFPVFELPHYISTQCTGCHADQWHSGDCPSHFVHSHPLNLQQSAWSCSCHRLEYW